jgi:hypothetical protein
MKKPWMWERDGGGLILRDGRGRNRANVWSNGVWHTWDTDGVGGENGEAIRMNGEVPVPPIFVIRDAMDQAMAAVARQGWTPWKVVYQKAEPGKAK